MAKPIQEIEWTGEKTDDAVDHFLRTVSAEQPGVWFARGVFGQVTIRQFPTVSAIPDAWAGRAPRPELWKGGRTVSWTRAQLDREQARGLRSDR